MANPPEFGNFNQILSRLSDVADRLEQSSVLVSPGRVPAAAAAPTAAGLAPERAPAAQPTAPAGPLSAAGLAAGAAAAAAAGGGLKPGAKKAASAAAPSRPLPVRALPPPVAVQDSAIAQSFDVFVQSCIPELRRLGAASDAVEMQRASDVVDLAFQLLYAGVAATAVAAKPKDDAWASILAPVMELKKAHSTSIDNRSDYIHSLKAAGEAVQVVLLISQPEPQEFVQGVLDTVDFLCTKAIQRKVQAEVDWAKALKAAVVGLSKWCGDNCKGGLPWKADGQDGGEYFAARPLGKVEGTGADAAKAESPAPAAAAAAAAATATAPGPAGGGMGMAGLMNGLAAGAGNLKKVTSDMKTKNRKDEAPLAPKTKEPAPAAAAPKVAGRFAKGPKGPPIKELQRGTHWMIENQEGDNNIVLDEVEMKNVVCIINCKSITLHIKGKVKSINVDACERVNIICHDVLSAVEFVNSTRTALQTTGTIKAISIDKCDILNLFLSRASADAEITTAKSTEMNVNIPSPDDEDEMIEIPIPEQFVTRIVGKKAKTEVSALYTQ